MAQAPQQLISRHRAAQLGTRQSAAGNDQLVAGIGTVFAIHTETVSVLLHFRYFRSGHKRDILLIQGKTQHIHHGVGLVGIRVYPAAGFCHSKQAQATEPRKCFRRAEFFQGIPGKRRVIPVISALQGVQITQITAAVSSGAKFSAHSRLPFQQDDLGIRILRRRQCRGHTCRAAANNNDRHRSSPTFFPIILYTHSADKKNFPCKEKKL